MASNTLFSGVLMTAVSTYPQRASATDCQMLIGVYFLLTALSPLTVALTDVGTSFRRAIGVAVAIATAAASLHTMLTVGVVIVTQSSAATSAVIADRFGPLARYWLLFPLLFGTLAATYSCAAAAFASQRPNRDNHRARALLAGMVCGSMAVVALLMAFFVTLGN
ncbi:hypothetical protein VH571_13480 [Frondihabitans sp. 4ASC-45]|uniref:hypothetical protein n=1 Tax=Frondihabitans sp. 4ASC-45 TaxID=3111636 RepID=UPI003C1E94CC